MQLTIQSALLTTTHLWFSVETVTPLALDTYSGSSLRGLLFTAIWNRFCVNRSAPSCAACELHATCPVSALVAPLREESPGGQDIPRPYVIIPPQARAHHYHVGESFAFGMTLIGSIVQLLPYILLALPQMEAMGLGRPLSENTGQRGRFRVKQVECYHPFTKDRQTIYEEGNMSIQAPVITVGPLDRITRAAQLSQKRITLQFLTPLRLIDRKQTVKQARFSPLIQRLLERFLALERYYADEPQEQQQSIDRDKKNAWLHLADGIRCIQDATQWQEVQSYSNRQKRATPIGGIIGSATFEGDLSPFLDLLVLGELIHVGKNVVKGDGWYTCMNDDPI